MAENENRSSEDLTDEISTHRLEEFRQKGMVSQSRELTGLISLFAVGVCAYITFSHLGLKIAELMREVFDTRLVSPGSDWTHLAQPSVLKDYFVRSMLLVVTLLLPVCAVGFIAGGLASFLQVGPLFTLDPLSFDLSRIDPLSGLKKFISKKQWIETVRIFLKVILVGWISYGFLKKEIFLAASHFWQEPHHLLPQVAQLLQSVFFAILGVMSVFAVLDFWLQRQEYRKNLKLTKQEAKQEAKEREGNPQTRSRIRSMQRHLARRRTLSAVKKADVLITNPTHFAVALIYQKNSMSAPQVVAKGADRIAQKMKEVAREANIPMVENVPLAQTLFKTVKVGQVIPQALYQAVAEVLTYVYQLKRKGF